MKALITLCVLVLFAAGVKAYECTVELLDTRGNTVATFLEWGSTNACEVALKKCHTFVQEEVKFKGQVSCQDPYGKVDDVSSTLWEQGFDNDII